MNFLRHLKNTPVNRIESNQVIVIWKDRPGLQLKLKFLASFENYGLKQGQLFIGFEKVSFLVRGRSDEVSTGFSYGSAW